MNTNLLKSLLLMVGAASATASLAQEAREITPVLNEGKSWLIGTPRSGRNDFGEHYDLGECVEVSRIAVEGDTVVDGREYKLLSSCRYGSDGPKSWALAYEENGAVYGSEFGSKDANHRVSILFDTSLNMGESTPLIDILTGELYYEDGFGPRVTDVRTLTVNGQEVRELTLGGPLYGYGPYYWVEGVGADTNIWLSRFPMIPTHRPFSFMLACYQDDKCIFTMNDFSEPGYRATELAETLADGRSWLYERLLHSQTGGEPMRLTYEVKVAGDTIANGFLCRKLVETPVDPATGKPQGEPRVLTAYEKGPVLYLLQGTDDAGKPLISPLTNFDCRHQIDFGSPVERCDGVYNKLFDDNSNALFAKACNTLTINGEERMELVLTVNNRPDDSPVCWVEGIGSSADIWISVLPAPEYPGYTAGTARMLECRQDGEVIFTAKDFSVPFEHASLSEVSAAQPAADGAVYDLQGRRVVTPVPGHIYIHNGKKFRNE